MLRHQMTLVFLLSFFTLLSACSSRDGGVVCNTGESCTSDIPTTTTTTQSSFATGLPLACTVTPSATLVSSGSTLSLTVNASGGTTPYSVPGYVTSFNPSTSFSGTVINTSGASIVLSKNVTIYDAIGNATTCPFSVTVASGTVIGGTSGAFQCSITPSVANPQIGAPVNFTVQAYGAVAGSVYTFGQFYPGGSAAPITPTTVSNGTVTASYTYTTAGNFVPQIQANAGGNAVLCTMYPQSLYVGNSQLFISNSHDALDPNTIHIQIYPVGLNPNAIVQYTVLPVTLADKTIPEPGITVNTISNSAFDFVNTDNGNHTFQASIIAVASDGTTVNQLLPLSYHTVMNCTLTGPAAVALGAAVNYSVTDPSGAIKITSIYSNPALQVNSGLNTSQANVTFPAIGLNILKVSAVSALNGAACNGGQPMALVVQVNPPLVGCAVGTDVPVIMAGYPVRIDIRPNGGAGPFNVVLNPQGNTTADGVPFSNSPDLTSQYITYNYPGNGLLLSASVTDATGAQAHCSAQINVVGQNGLLAKVYDVPSGTNLTSHPNLEVDFSDCFHEAFYIPGLAIDERPADCGDGNSCTKCEFPYVTYDHGFGKSWYAIEFTGYINIPVTGTYNFQFVTDQTVQFTIDNVVQSTSGFPHLTAGTHAIRINYLHGSSRSVELVFLMQQGASGVGGFIPYGPLVPVQPFQLFSP